MYKLLLLLFLALHQLSADEAPVTIEIPAEVDVAAIPSLVNLTSLPTAIVNGSVNVITGDFCESDEEDVIYSPDPYVLGHTYFSSSLDEGNLGAGWNFLHHHLIEVFQPARISYTKSHFDFTPYLLPITATAHLVVKDIHPTLHERPLDNVRDRVHDAKNYRGHNKDQPKNSDEPNPVFLSLYDPAGGRLLYKAKFDESHKERSLRHFSLESKLSGYTNIVSGNMSGQTNLKNIKIEWDKKEDAFHVLLGDGTERVYERQWKTHVMKKRDKEYAEHYRDYHLHKEKKPNGQLVIYDYNDDYEIVKIRALNKDLSHKLYEVYFDQKKAGAFAKEPTLDVTTSDGFQHTYYFKRLAGSPKHGTYSVSHIRREGRPYTNYVYSEKSSRHDRRVNKKETEGGFYVTTKYYSSSSDSKFLKNRVRMQLAPLGPEGQEVITHRYFYYKDSNGGGHCTVRDAYNTISRHYWNKDKRLIRVSKSTECDKHLMTERYYWGENDTEEEGMLLSRVLEDENSNPILAHTFRYDSRGNVIEDALYGQITENSGKLVLKNGRPKHETCDKQVTTYTYTSDGLNLLKSIKDPLGNFTYFEYKSGTNLLTAKFICDKTKVCKREFFEYDINGLCVEHIVDDGTTKESNSLEGAKERHITRTKYRYERPRFGEASEVIELFYNFTENKEAFLKKTINHFNEKGFVVKRELVDQLGNIRTYEYGYDHIGRVTYSLDPLGQRNFFDYDKLGRLIKKVGTRNDVHWEYEYDLAGRLICEREMHKEGLILKKRYEYDLLGRKIATYDTQNNATRYEYDALNRVKAIIYPPIYDHNGRKALPKKTFSYKNLGTEVTETDENGLQTITTYNALGKVCKKVFADNTCQKAYYDIQGNMVKEVAANGAIREVSYDAFSRPKKSLLKMGDTVLSKSEVRYNSFHPILEIGPTGEKTVYTYDHAGRKASVTKQGTRTTKYVYDAAGRLYRERTFLANGAFIGKRYKYDALDRVTYEALRDDKERQRTYKEYTYDAEGNVRTTTTSIEGKKAKTLTRYYPHSIPKVTIDAKGNQTSYELDYSHLTKHGQTVLKKRTVSANGVIYDEVYDARGALSEAISYAPDGTCIAKKELYYDKAGSPVRVQEYAIAGGEERKKIITLFTYQRGKLVQITEASGTSEEKITRYAYNDFGQKKSDTFSDGAILRYRYDGKGRVLRYFAADKSIDMRYEYDASDRILSMTNAITGKKTTRSYNKFGELKKETLENGLTLSYSYDKAGRPIEVTLPDKSAVTYSYSALLEKITRRDTEGIERYSHTIKERDLSGLVKSCELINKSTLTYTHDRLGRTKTITHEKFSQTAKKFDAVGNLISLHTIDASGEKKQSFGYDFLSQLTQEDSTTYTYDSLYNRLSHNDDVYDVNSFHSVLSDSRRTFTYDARGNRTTMQEGMKVTRYTYDVLDRLVGVELPEGKRYEYHYDGFNRRVTKEAYLQGPFGWQKETVTNYLYAGNNEIGAAASDNTITELRVLGEGLGAEIGAAVAYELHGTTYTPLHDRIGNVVAMLDIEGNLIEHYRYDAFGNETTSTPTPLNPWRFASKRSDPETGMVYFGRRYYDPTLGKWLTQDPLGLKAGPNLYAYCLNNPLTKLDHYGLLDEPATQERSFSTHLRDILSDGFNTIKNWICRGLEAVVHHMPHIFGDRHDRAEDTIRGWRGAPQKTRMPAGVYKVFNGKPTATGCALVGHPNGLDCDFDDALKNATLLKDGFEGNHPDVYVIYSPTHGMCTDLWHAFINMFGYETENVKNHALGFKELSEIVSHAGAGAYWLLSPHSNGGQTSYLASRYLSKEELGKMHVESVASAKIFHTSQGFASAKNHAGWSDFVPIIADTFGVIYRGFMQQGDLQMHGHPFHAPFSRHAYTGKDFNDVVRNIAKNHM